MAKAVAEPLLQEDDNRFVMFPIKSQRSIRGQETSRMFLITEEVDLSKDAKHWESLNDNERYFISMILAFLQERWYCSREPRDAFYGRSAVV